MVQFDIESDLRFAASLQSLVVDKQIEILLLTRYNGQPNGLGGIH